MKFGHYYTSSVVNFPRMPKRPSSLTHELTALAAELNDLNLRRQVVTHRIGKLVAALVNEDALSPETRRRSESRRLKRPGRVRRRRGGRPKGFKVSAATRAKLRAAWKRRKTGGS